MRAYAVLFRYEDSGQDVRSWLVFAVDGASCSKIRATIPPVEAVLALDTAWSVLVGALDKIEAALLPESRVVDRMVPAVA